MCMENARITPSLILLMLEQSFSWSIMTMDVIFTQPQQTKPLVYSILKHVRESKGWKDTRCTSTPAIPLVGVHLWLSQVQMIVQFVFGINDTDHPWWTWMQFIKWPPSLSATIAIKLSVLESTILWKFGTRESLKNQFWRWLDIMIQSLEWHCLPVVPLFWPMPWTILWGFGMSDLLPLENGAPRSSLDINITSKRFANIFLL